MDLYYFYNGILNINTLVNSENINENKLIYYDPLVY